MIRLVALDTDLVDKLVDIVTDYYDEVERGNVITDQPRADEMHDAQAILAALRNTESRN